MAYFYSDSISDIFLPSNLIPYCQDKFKVDLGNKKLNLLREKASKYDEEIYNKNQKVYEIINIIDYYYKTHSHKDNNYKTFELVKKNFDDKMKKDDRMFFTNSSDTEYYIDGTFLGINFLDIINDIVDDFNTNYFEYYLMAQHTEQYSCCYLFTFRQVSKFFTRTINCPFFYCHFDRGVQNYLDDLDKLEFEYNIDEDGNKFIKTTDQIKDNIVFLKEYLSLREDFKNDLIEFYKQLFEFFTPYIKFLVHLKVILKVVSIISIIINSHRDDSDMFADHASTLLNLIREGALAMNPGVTNYYYTFLIGVYQSDVVPMILDMKHAIDKEGPISPQEKAKLNKVLILYSMAAIGMTEKCQALFSQTTYYNLKIKEDKKKYFSKQSEDFIEHFLAKAYINDTRVNSCYIINYDNPRTPEELKKIKDKVDKEDNTDKDKDKEDKNGKITLNGIYELK